jgi:hypothetical protein
MKRALLSNHHRCVGVDLTLAVILAASFPLKAAANAELPVVVRTFNYAQLPAEQLASARVKADVIFKSAGISVQWIDCQVAQSGSGAPCTEPLSERGDLMLRLTDDAPALGSTSGRIVALGTSMLDREQRGGVLMTVDVFPIRAIAGKTSTDVPTLLGRAIAHEMGHLLLGSSTHPKTGLMRALWSHEELRGLKPAHWQFTHDEAAQMRHGLAAKERNAN